MSENRAREGFWAKVTGAGTVVLVILGVLGLLGVFSGASNGKVQDNLGSSTPTLTQASTSTSTLTVTPPSTPTLDLSSSSGPPGSRLTVSGGGFGAGERVNISFQGMLIAHAIADQRGLYSTSIAVPSLGGLTGNMTIVAAGATGSHAEEPFDLT
jgi:hypothetical protein